jgi:hypothetical protein
MIDFKKESRAKNKQNGSEHINSASDHQTTISDTTSQMKVSSKIEIKITRKQLNAAKWLFEQAGKRKPDWLRQKFIINQYRRKCLNAELIEAQLDSVFCDHYQDTEAWYDLLHLLWHQINGVPSCK